MATGGLDRPHLTLYVDVNKTIIMQDPIQGKDIENVLNDILAEHAIGKLAQNGTWVWNGLCSSLGAQSCDYSAHEISYASFLRTAFPNEGSPEIMRKRKHERKMLRKNFTAKGSPGEHLAPELEAMKSALRLPVHIQRSQEAIAVGLTSEYCFIVPSFFNAISKLHSSGRSFNLIFRTYGQDLHHIAREFNAFCEGRHPLFPSVYMDGRDSGVDRRLYLDDTNGIGTFYRNESRVVLVMGTLLQPTDHTNGLELYDSIPCVSKIEGFRDIHAYLTTSPRRRATVAIRDYYHWWWTNYESAQSGKLMVLDLDKRDHHCVFFDDNILAHDPHIVDVRCSKTGESIPFERTRGVYLIRADPLLAIRSPCYFTDMLNQAESAFQHQQNSAE